MKLITGIAEVFFFRHFFVALCAASMTGATYLLSGYNLRLTPALITISAGTLLLYNLHSYAHRLNYRDRFRGFFSSFTLVEWLAALVFLIFFFQLRLQTQLLFVPVILLSALYSSGFLRRSYFTKMPVLAFVWSFSTVIIPLAEEGHPLASPFIVLMSFARALFVFALCVPFELRDLVSDGEKSLKTLPVRFGINVTRMLGISALIIEMALWLFLSGKGYLSPKVTFFISLSSAAALIWIILEGKVSWKYFHKFIVDGTMILRFILIFISLTPANS